MKNTEDVRCVKSNDGKMATEPALTPDKDGALQYLGLAKYFI
ncbi:hypothetical protein [Lacrimispora sp.]|nr:hypothetical protein [Lacrimispora sp.]